MIALYYEKAKNKDPWFQTRLLILGFLLFIFAEGRWGVSLIRWKKSLKRPTKSRWWKNKVCFHDAGYCLDDIPFWHIFLMNLFLRKYYQVWLILIGWLTAAPKLEEEARKAMKLILLYLILLFCLNVVENLENPTKFHIKRTSWGQ